MLKLLVADIDPTLTIPIVTTLMQLDCTVTLLVKDVDVTLPDSLSAYADRLSIITVDDYYSWDRHSLYKLQLDNGV